MVKRQLVFLSILISSLLLTGCTADDFSVATNTLIPSSQVTSENGLQTKLPSTSYPEQGTDGFIIAVAGRDYGSLFLIETESKEYRKLEIPGDVGINVYGWSEDACNLFIGTESNQIVKVDIEGNLKQRLANIDELAIDGNVVDAKVSQDEKWIAFLSGTGQQGFATYEFQNLITVAIGNQQSQVYHLTSSGAVKDMTWSPDGTLISFNDNDINGVQQIFISNADGSEINQLTNFDKKEFVITSLQWSPDGDRLAFAIGDESKNTSYLAIANTSIAHNIINITTIADVNKFWWASNDIVVADVLPLGKNPSSATDRIIAWYDVSTGEELGKISSITIPDGIFELPGPLITSSNVGFFAGQDFYSYDIFSLEIKQIFNKFADIRYWISAPRAFDRDGCRIQK